MSKHKTYCLLLPMVCITTLCYSCKKSATTNNNNGGGADTTVTIPPAVDPSTEKTQGFFMDDWAAKSFTAPAYTIAEKPANSSVTIDVDATNIVTKISTNLFGNNANPYMSQIVTEPALLNNIRQLHPKIIRFPGGNISSVYLWNAATGVVPSTAPLKIKDANGANIDAGYWFGKNDAGWTLSVDNYYNTLQQTGNEGIITVNYGYARYGTGANPVADAAHLAADWVRYDNGKTKYWEIGNESNGTWQAGYRIDVAQNKDGQPEFITGELYGKHVKVFVDSMRKAAQEIGKAIYIGVQLLEGAPASWQTPTDQNWNAGVIKQAGSVTDYYIVHSYFTPYNTNSKAIDILNSAPSNTKNIMTYVTGNIAANGGTVKPIALTEWNIFATGSMQMVSHVSGVHAVMVLGELMKNKFGMASRWDLCNGWDNGNDHGMFNSGDEPGGVARWNPRPAFYHMYYFQKYMGDRMVSSTSSSTDIVSYATTFSSGQSGIAIVNTSTSDKTVTINLKNFKSGEKYYWYTLTGGNDNGEFSRKVYINGIGPSVVSGGPENYATVQANTAMVKDGIRITAPGRSVSFLVVEK